MLVLDRAAGLLPFDATPLTAMDPAGLSLFASDAPNEPVDQFANPFRTADSADDSLFFLFPSTVRQDEPPLESIDHPIASSQMIAPAHYISRPAKSEPEFSAMRDELAMPPHADLTDPLSIKRKRADALLPLADDDAKTDLTAFLPPTDSFTASVYVPPTKRSRRAPNSSSFPNTTDSYSALSPHVLSDETKLISKPEPVSVPLVENSSSKSRSPTSRRRKKTIDKTSSSSGGSDSDSGSAVGSASGSRKVRTLSQMKTLARSHAPEVALTQDELQQIAAMRESDEELAASADMYRELLAFKQVLARSGYRLASISLDPFTDQEAADRDESFDFVLKRRIKPTAFASANPSNNPALDGGSSLSQVNPTYSRKRVKASAGDSPADSQGVSCTVCSKKMVGMDCLVRHFRHTHQELKPFWCPRCKGPYASEGTLWHHIRHVHSQNARKFRCSKCDASYDSYGAKTRHEHATHNTDTPEFVCSFEGCNREFNFPAHLESHAIQEHPGFRPFACTECSKRFNSANGLIRHKREVHRRTRAYRCTCGQSFAKKDHLKRHLLQRHGMSYERATDEMRKQPSPGLVHFMPPAAPAAAEAG